MIRLLAWLRGAGKQSISSVASVSPLLPECEVQYLDAYGREVPTVNQAVQRRETRQLPQATETRLYQMHDGPEWLREVSRADHANGARCRVCYWPWGKERSKAETSFPGGKRRVEYQEWFGNGELRRHKCAEAGQLRQQYMFLLPQHGYYTYTEQMPVYPGGADQLLADINRAIKYPAAALRKQEQGKVFIHFLVRPDGVMTDITVQKGVTSTLDRAALEAVEQLGRTKRWQPGFQNRRAVSVTYTVPITFSIK